jgi:hypothetical protein
MNTLTKAGAVIVALTAGAGGVLAASSHEAVGRIERINAKSHHLTVNHRVYHYTSQAEAQNLKPGGRVRVQYRWRYGHRVAEKILPAPA